MELTREELQKYIYDPNMLQKIVLDNIETATNGEIVISDPTSPFTMLLETAAVTSANAAIESKNIIRRKYPSLATKEDELYHHISDNELANMFAIPADTYIVFYVNILDLKTTGFRPTGASYVETTIPEGTEITILDTPLTLLNDIVVRLYDNDTIFVEQQQNENDIAFEDIGVIPATITTNNEGTPWIIFETRVKQVKKLVKNIAVSVAEGFNHIISSSDKYFYSEVSYKNSNTNDKYVKLEKSHNEEYIDPTIPTVFISVYGNEVLYRIPDLYLVDGGISGNVNIELYETKGNIYLPINKYTIEDFNIVLGNTGKNESASTSANIAILANSRSILEGGSNGMSLEELRHSIINNTKGDIDLPVTDYQLQRYANMSGYEIFKSLDVITERLYIATKSLPKVSSNLILAKQDVFFNTTQVILEDILTNTNINIQNDNFIIKSNTIFKEVNSIIKIVSNDELKYISSLNNIQKMEYLKVNKYFYTPYYYIINNDDMYSTSRVYDLDRPILEDLRIVGKNTTVNQRVNIDKFTILKTVSGYRLVFTVISNDEFKLLNPNLTGLQLKMSLKGTNSFVYFNAVRDISTGYYIVDINTDLFIDDDNYLDLLNGTSDIFNKRFNIDNYITVYIYTTDGSVVDNTNYLNDEINKEPNSDYVILSKEKLKVTFGRKVEYIWNRLYNTYTERKYLKYEYDIPLVYEEDVYEVDPETGSIYTCTTVDGIPEITTNKLFSKGDYVLDDVSNQILKHKKGDVILDENQLPIINSGSGVIRFIDILMLEYEFRISNSNAYVNYKETTLDILHSYLFEDLPNLNNKLLENTKLLYKSYKSSKNVIVNINNVYYSMPYIVKPLVTLYVTNKVSLTNDEIELYKNTIGTVINNYLNNTVIKLDEIKKEIMTTIGDNVVAVKINNIDPNNSEVITIRDKTTRLVLNKLLDLNKNNELIVKYDIEVIIQYV